MRNDELAKIRQEIKESVLTENLEQHYGLYEDDIAGELSSQVQEEDWDKPAMGRDSRDPFAHLGDAYGRDLQGGMPVGGLAGGSEVSLPTRRMTTHRGSEGVPGHVQDYGEELQSSDPVAFAGAGGWEGVGELDPTRVPGYRGADLPTSVQDWGETLGKEDPEGFSAAGGMGKLGRLSQQGDIDVSQIPNTRDVAYGRDMGMAYKGDTTMTWEEMTGDEAYNRDPDDSNMWESKSATVRGWIIENFKPLRSDGYDPQRIVKVLNERPETELTHTMLGWFHENKRQLQKDGYDFDLVVDKLNED